MYILKEVDHIGGKYYSSQRQTDSTSHLICFSEFQFSNLVVPFLLNQKCRIVPLELLVSLLLFQRQNTMLWSPSSHLQLLKLFLLGKWFNTRWKDLCRSFEMSSGERWVVWEEKNLLASRYHKKMCCASNIYWWQNNFQNFNIFDNFAKILQDSFFIISE